MAGYEPVEWFRGANAMQSQITSRRDEIIKLREGGLTYAESGRRYGISAERVRQILKWIPPPERPDLWSKLVLRLDEATSLLGIHANTLRCWSDKGVIKAYRISPRGDRRPS